MTFTPRYNGTAKFVHPIPHRAYTIAIDAPLYVVGGVLDNHIYSEKIPEQIRIGECIVHFEMINILVALNIWKCQWHSKEITFYVDICKNGNTTDSLLATYAGNIWLLTAV